VDLFFAETTVSTSDFASVGGSNVDSCSEALLTLGYIFNVTLSLLTWMIGVMLKCYAFPLTTK